MNSTTMSMIKDLKNGNLYCNLCSMQIKCKMLTAHINGRKHREAAASLKEEKEPSSSTINMKRKAVDEFGIGNNIKKLRNEMIDMTKNNDGDRHTLPKLSLEVPKNDGKQYRANLLDELPTGFFDDEKMDNRMVLKTVEKQKHINFELDRFYKEVEEFESQKEETQNELLEFSTIQNHIEMVDEHIERWKTINELEKQKEAVIEAATAIKFDQQPNFDPVEVIDDDDDFDLMDNVNWRTKTI